MRAASAEPAKNGNTDQVENGVDVGIAAAVSPTTGSREIRDS